MREILAARSDRDFVVAAPARRGPAKGRKKESLGQQVFAFVWRYPLEIAISIALTGAAIAIVWNALALQTARHPAPLFSPRGLKPEAVAPQPLPPTRPALSTPAPVQAPVPVPTAQASPPAASPAQAVPLPPRPAARDSIGELIRNGDAPQTARPAAAPAKPAPARDGIGDLIRLGDPAPVPPGYVGKPEPTRIVTAGQKALSKLGYGPLTADGLMGQTTRQGVERFERDRRLPVTGEISGRTARELAAQAGIPVE